MTLLYVLVGTSLALNFMLIGVLFYFYLKSNKKHKQECKDWKDEKSYYIKKHILAYDDEHEKFTMKGETKND